MRQDAYADASYTRHACFWRSHLPCFDVAVRPSFTDGIARYWCTMPSIHAKGYAANSIVTS
jgi:hypothetical protein